MDSKDNFIKHVQIMHEQQYAKGLLSLTGNFEEFQCMDCKKVFKTINNLRCHRSLVHKIQVTVCEYCCKEFKNRIYHGKHVKLIHESYCNERITCNLCGKSYKSKGHLYHHKRAVHERSEEICFICAKVCKNEDALKSLQK